VVRRSAGGRAQLTWRDREGKSLGTAGGMANILGPRISPDQKSLIFSQADGMSSDIWMFDTHRGNTTRFSFAETASSPVWSPDGSRIAYSLRTSNETRVVSRPVSGMGKETVLYRSSAIFNPASWSRDGRWLVLMNVGGSAYMVPTGPGESAGERMAVPFHQSSAESRQFSISPDGRWLLYSSTQGGSREVFVESLPEQFGGSAAAIKKQVSIAGGIQPAWRADGKELFYIAGDDNMMAVSVESDAAGLKLGVPKPLFPAGLELDFAQRQYDVSADGKRFLLAQPPAERASAPITVIVNWPALLKKAAR
jgi:eukaryotic-like serine/threonine-protein kinase